MIEVTESAQKKLGEYLSANTEQESAIRVFISSGG